jgi:hypothetical protein
MRQPPAHGHGHRPEHVVPGGVKDLGHARPTQPLRPRGQKPRVGRGELVLALGPGNGLHPHPAARALHSLPGIDEEDGQAPQGDELEAPGGQRVVAGAGSLTPRAPRLAIGAAMQLDLQMQPPGRFPEPHGAVYEAGLRLQPIQDSLELHPVLPTSCKDDWVAPPSSQSRERDASHADPGPGRRPVPPFFPSTTIHSRLFQSPAAHRSIGPIPGRRARAQRAKCTGQSFTHRFVGRPKCDLGAVSE